MIENANNCINNLPIDLIGEISSYLDVMSRKHLSITSKNISSFFNKRILLGLNDKSKKKLFRMAILKGKTKYVTEILLDSNFNPKMD